MKLRSVQLWCERAGRRLYAIRHAPHTGFGRGERGLGPARPLRHLAVWQEARRTRAFLPHAAPVDCAGSTSISPAWSTRCTASTRQCAPARAAVRPRRPDAQDARGARRRARSTPSSRSCIACCRTPIGTARSFDWRVPDREPLPGARREALPARAGYHTMPISGQPPHDQRGREVRPQPGDQDDAEHQRAQRDEADHAARGHKAVDPALLFYNDDGVTKLVTKPGGLNPGLVDDGRPAAGAPHARRRERLAVRGRNDPGRARADQDRLPRGILQDPDRSQFAHDDDRSARGDGKQGVLVRPYASRYATEKQHPMTQRDLDLALRAGQIEPFPPEVVEAGAWPVIDYENPLAAMARAESSSKTLRFLEALQPLAAIDDAAPDRRRRPGDRARLGRGNGGQAELHAPARRGRRDAPGAEGEAQRAIAPSCSATPPARGQGLRPGRPDRSRRRKWRSPKPTAVRYRAILLSRDVKWLFKAVPSRFQRPAQPLAVAALFLAA
jgi:hypothetical protein